MGLPRRVPWANLTELDQVCSWIYADENDTPARSLAVNRLSAWRTITPLPHALEATLSLLFSLLLDQQCHAVQNHRQRFAALTPETISAQGVRQAYASAIVRLVNGLVDPLQLGAYARSIAAIAAQIGLPQWLVELRHTATHEELPSLELLRAGARESLAWLLHNYFLPTLSASSSVDQPSPIARLSSLSPLLKQYKSLSKTVTRDASLKSQYRDNLTRVLRDIERWIGEAKVAASADLFIDWGASEQSEGAAESERWALERLCEALLERDGLVPVSSKKRLASRSKSLPKLPSPLVAIWSPLLSSLRTNHPSFPLVLVSTILNDMLARLSTPNNDAFSRKDMTHELCTAAWAAWCIDRWDITAREVSEEGVVPLKREDVIVSIVTALGVQGNGELIEDRRGARVLLDILVQAHPCLEGTIRSLLSVLGSGLRHDQNWIEEDALVMEGRLRSLLSSALTSTETGGGLDPVMDVGNCYSAKPIQVEMPKGWTKAAVGPWRACPIGVPLGSEVHSM
ncbi:hypothetical protein M0805_000315 [Coniferiporia weirii]|nr:hypothetical protein M0805_000315 [Coniferiporia weirii]